MRLNKVVLPDPFGPITPRISPASTVRLTFFTAATPPKLLEILSRVRRVTGFSILDFRLIQNRQSKIQNDTATLSLVKRLRRVRKRRRGDVLRPNQLLRPFLPLDKHPWDLSRPIWTESHRSRYRDHIRGRNPVADFVPVQSSRP